MMQTRLSFDCGKKSVHLYQFLRFGEAFKLSNAVFERWRHGAVGAHQGLQCMDSTPHCIGAAFYSPFIVTDDSREWLHLIRSLHGSDSYSHFHGFKVIKWAFYRRSRYLLSQWLSLPFSFADGYVWGVDISQRNVSCQQAQLAGIESSKNWNWRLVFEMVQGVSGSMTDQVYFFCPIWISGCHEIHMFLPWCRKLSTFASIRCCIGGLPFGLFHSEFFLMPCSAIIHFIQII